jgi:hypothetical protein
MMKKEGPAMVGTSLRVVGTLTAEMVESVVNAENVVSAQNVGPIMMDLQA